MVSLAFGLLLTWPWGPAAALEVNPNAGPLGLGEHYRYLEDRSTALSLEQVLRGNPVFRPLRGGAEPNLGYRNSAYWFRVPLFNPDREPQPRYLELPFPTLDEVDVYLYDPGSDEVLSAYRSGDQLPFAHRPLPEANFAFPLVLPAAKQVVLYLRVRTKGSMTVGATLWPPDQYRIHSRNGYVLMSLYLGVLAALLAYNLLLYLSLRDATYLLYVLFVASMAVGQGSWNGYFFQWLWPHSPAWGNLAAVLGFNATGMFGALFSRAFLTTKSQFRLLDRVLLVCAASFGLLLFAAPFIPYSRLAVLTSITGVTFSLVAVAGAVICLLHGLRSARYFLLAWTLLLMGTAALGARNLDLLPTNFFTLYAMQIGSALEMLLLSFALAERINELRAMKERAEASSRAKDEFLAIASHEIRTPLTVILGNARLLQREALAPRARALNNAVRRSSEQLLVLLNDLLDMSRLETGKMRFDKTPFRPEQLADELVGLMAPVAEDRGLYLRLEKGPLPSQLLGDGTRVRQVLFNLLGNALKFTDSGGVTLEIAVLSTGGAETVLQCAVSDTGQGISDADQSRLFRPYAQLGNGTTRTNAPGAGLGLAIARELVHGMGGQIGVVSTPGKGSRFWFKLPLAVCETQAHTRQETTEARRKLLLVEDTEETRQVLTALLDAAGHRVHAVADGNAALAAVTRQPFDGVLLDLQMPGMDGYETCRQLRQTSNGSHIPIIALTANPTGQVVEACNRAGFDSVADKSSSVEQLEGVMASISPSRDTHPPDQVIPGGQSVGLLDDALLHEYCNVAGKVTMGSVVAAYLSAIEARFSQLTAERENSDRLHAELHAMEQTAQAMGMTELASFCAQFDSRLATPPCSTDEWKQRTTALHACLERSNKALKMWCQRQGIAIPSQ